MSKGAIGNAFGISGASDSAITTRVSYATTEIEGPELIKLSTTEINVKEITNLGTCEFPQCAGTLDDTHIEIAEVNEHYTDYINRKGFISTFKLCNDIAFKM